ncbi:hypothetical protein Tco_0023647, partial [Tanacetum coccineum]
GRIADIDVDARINLVSTHFDADTNMFGVHDLVSDEVVVDSKVVVKAASTIPVSAATTTTTVITDDEITLAKALAELKSFKLPTIIPKAKGIVIHKQEQVPTPTVSSQQPSRLNIQDKAMIDAYYQMAQQIQAEEQEKLRIEEKSKLFVQLLEARKKHFANNQLKNKRFDDIQKLFDKAMKRVNTFVDMETELVEGSEVRAEAEIAQVSSSKRADNELEQESIKKQ